MSTTGYIGRFAPSPTGPLHFGSLLAALGSYLQARTANGRWLVRIEDLDTPRTVARADQLILDTLAKFGFEWDGTVEYQSRRLPHYAAALDRLRASGRAFACVCSRAQIASWHTNRDSTPTDLLEGDELAYPGTCRLAGIPWHAESRVAIRMALPDDAQVQFVDAAQGLQTQDVAATCGDFVVRRRDGYFAYHLAVVVDDALQGVTEVVRGADLLGSTARQIHLQRALDLPTPHYCHLPLAVDGLGRKLSKSSQSLAIEPQDAPRVLWHALVGLRQDPPDTLRHDSVRAIWRWALDHWSIQPLRGTLSCSAPAGLAISDG